MDEGTLLSEPVVAPSEGYRGVVLVLLAATSTATIVGVAIALMFGNPVLLQSAVSLALASGVLFLIAFAVPGRVQPAELTAPPDLQEASGDASDAPAADVTGGAVPVEVQGSAETLPSQGRGRALSPTELLARVRSWRVGAETTDLPFIIGSLGALAVAIGELFGPAPTAPAAATAAIGTLVCEASAIRSEADLEAARIRAKALEEQARIRGKSAADVAKTYGEAHRLDPELYRFTRSLESIDKLITANTSLILRTDSEPFSLLQGKDGK